MKFRYEDLRVGEVILRFIDLVYSVSDSFPDDERFGLRSQVRRAAFSVYLNIAEGSARKSGPDFARFITIGLGSLVEVDAALKIAFRRGYVEEQEVSEIRVLIEQIWPQLCALRKSQSA